MTINTPTEDTKVTVLWKKTKGGRCASEAAPRTPSPSHPHEHPRGGSTVLRLCRLPGKEVGNCNPTRRDEHATQQCLQDIRSDSGPALRSLGSQAQFGVTKYILPTLRSLSVRCARRKGKWRRPGCVTLRSQSTHAGGCLGCHENGNPAW